MNIKRFLLMSAIVPTFAGVVAAQSFYDDIYYDASKEPAKKTVTVKSGSAPSYAATMPSADTYTVTGTRTISVDDYNRRGVFATDTLSADTTVTDFTYTRRIEQFYNPEIVIASGDEELAQIYYTEPTTVNIYVNTPTAYWGYDYFYPSTAWALGWGPYYGASWRWSSPWYWNSWYDPYWSWSWGWNYGWGPGWGWGPSWGWSTAWAPGYSRPVNNNWNPRHPGMTAGNSFRPGNSTRPGDTFNPGSASRPGVGGRPGITNGGAATRPGMSTYPSIGTVNPSGGRPGVGTVSPATGGSSSRPGTQTTPTYNNNNNYNYSRPATNGGRQPSYGSGSSFGSGSRGSSGSFGGGSRGGSAGGRGRH